MPLTNFVLLPIFSLCQSDILSELITLIVEEPSSDLDDTLRFKLPHIAAEVRTFSLSREQLS